MKFIGRNRELTALEQARQGAVRGPSRMTVVTGRRRVGKTALILKSLSDKPFVYLFVSISSEADLCAGFVAQIRHALGNGIFIPSSIRRFSELFEVLLAYSKKIH